MTRARIPLLRVVGRRTRTRAGASSNETNIPAQQPATQAYTRISCAHGHQGRTEGDKSPACQGTRPPDPVGLPVTGSRFPKRSRLSSPAQFREAFARGKRCNTDFFTVIAVPNGLDYARLGLAVSKRKARLAVQRNRLKRLIRESFRVNQQRLSGVDIVVIPRAPANGASSAALRASLEALWNRLERQCAS